LFTYDGAFTVSNGLEFYSLEFTGVSVIVAGTSWSGVPVDGTDGPMKVDSHTEERLLKGFEGRYPTCQVLS